MKNTQRTLLAGLLAGSAFLAFAQAPATPAPPATTAQPVYVDATTASLAAGATGPKAEAANAIVQALNADAALKGSKLTVLPEEDGFLITGVTRTRQQKEHATGLATQHASNARVSNVALTEEWYPSPQAGQAGQGAQTVAQAQDFADGSGQANVQQQGQQQGQPQAQQQAAPATQQ